MVATSTKYIASTSNIDRDGAESNKEGARTPPLDLVSTSAATGDKGKRKRGEKGSVKRRKKQKKRRTAASDELNAEDDDDNYDEDEDVAESGSGEELTSDDEDEERSSTSSRQGTKGTTMDPSRFITDNETGRESAVNRNLPEPAAVEDIAHAPIVQLSTSNSGAAPLSTDTPLSGATPPSTDTPPLTIEGPHSVTLPPVDVKWPAWFGKAYAQLTSGNLGRTFSATILNYIEFEKRTSFGIGVAGAGFKIDKRPNEVGWWIARGRKVTPKITLEKLPAFEQAWWAWWKGLQPTAREATAVDGFLDATHRELLDGEDGWACVRKHGQNGWYTVLATLVWWATTLGDDHSSHAGWVAAMEDVSWVLSQVLGSSDSGSSK
jgi:hypothetical protein